MLYLASTQIILLLCSVLLSCHSSLSTEQSTSYSYTYADLLKITHSFPPLYFEHVNVGMIEVSKHYQNSSSDDLRSVVAGRTPTHITNHSARSWPALNWDLLQMSEGNWSELYGVLSLSVKRSLPCNQTEPSIFLSHMDSDNGNIRHSPTSIHIRPNLVAQMSMAQFLLNITSQSMNDAKRFLYSTEFDSLEEELQLFGTTNWTQLLVNESACTGNSKIPCSPAPGPVDPAQHPSPLLHLLHPGSALQARYSQYHTMRVQLKGTGRYYLSPPQHSAHPLHVYPFLHQRAGQAQMHLYEPKQDVCLKNKTSKANPPMFVSSSEAATTVVNSLFKDISLKLGANSVNGPMQVAELTAGEILYIPPFWNVHSEAVSFGVVLDVLSISLEQQILMPASFVAMPYSPEQIKTKEQRMVAAQVLLVHVLSRIHGVSSVKNISDALYQSRYSALYPENGLFLRKRSKFQCLRDDSEQYVNIVNKLDAEKVRVVAEFVASKVNSAHFSVGQPQRGAKWVWLAEYIEQMARWAMGAEEAVLFIKKCLFMDEVLPVIEEVLGPDAIVLKSDGDD